MKFFITFLLSSLIFLQAFAVTFAELKTKDPSLLNSYLELMKSKKLIHQTDIRLKKRRLLKHNGGLCAFTAGVNAVQAVSQYYQLSQSKFIKRPDFFLYEVIDEARSFMDKDPTYAGIDFPNLVKYTNDVLEDYNLDEYIRLKYPSLNAINSQLFEQQYWKLRLLGLLGEKGEGHTVVLLRVNKLEKLFYVSDPNYPNNIIEVPYSQKNQKLHVKLSDDFPGFQNAEIDEIIEVSIPRE